MKKITSKTRNRRGLVILAAVFSLTSTTLTVSAQTEPGPADPVPDAPKYDEFLKNDVCVGDGWHDVRGDPEEARACLTLIGVNGGAGAYAFARPAVGYDPDDPMGGGPEEAGLVSRWAMAEALTRTIEAAAGSTLSAPSAEAEDFFTDIGWLTADTRRRIAQLYNLEVTKGTSEAGVYDPAGPVTRGQMALFFVRTLSAIEELSQDGLPEFGKDWSVSSDTFSVVWEKEAERIASGLEEAPADCRASIGFRERVGMPFVDVCGWENDDERFPAIKLIYDLGVTRGVSADSEGRRYYRAAEPVTGGQMAMFLMRLLGHTGIQSLSDIPAVGEVELPAVQQDGSQRRLGTRNPDGSSLPTEEIRRGAREHNEPLPAPAATRPPREIDIYRYRSFPSEVSELNTKLALSDPASLQIGDWFWNQPPHSAERRFRYVLMEFRTAVGYTQVLPFTAAFFCVIPEGKPGPEDNPSSTRYAWNLKHVLPDAPGLFRLLNHRGADETFIADAGRCNLGEYDVPVPAGGYTERFPCSGIWPARVRDAWGNTDGWLLPCQP